MRKILKLRLEILFVFLIFSLIFGSGILLWISSFKLPDLNTISNRRVSESTKIFDRTGTVLLYDVHENIKRTIVRSDQISQYVKQATIAIEDDSFYEHSGIRPLSFLRAVIANVLSGEYSQGGSTITQQVIKNSVLTTEKSITRKIKEWILAIKLEKKLNKEQILTLYLNEAPYGGSIYGVEEASLSFFGKHADEITLAESAYLAALPNAPTFYSPHGKNKDALEKRKNGILQKMLDQKMIDDEEYKNALKEKVDFKPMETTGIKAPHFVMYVKSILDNQYGAKRIENEGFKIITTLDYELQLKAEETARAYAYTNEEKYNAENVGLVAIKVDTGEILTMVGSRDYFDNAIDGNFNITTAHRQPGSSFKPFVYAAALNKGYTPETIVFDVPTEFSTFCNPDGTPIYEKDLDKCYMPENYDNTYRGPITFKEALAQSINIPAIKALYLSGLRDSLSLAQAMGIKSLTDPNRYGLTLVLGGGEVTLLEMTSAYAVFANEGIQNNPISILKIEDSNGNLLFETKRTPKMVLDQNVAREITDMLSDEEARAPAFGYNSPLHFSGYDVAAKTGTTNDYKDAWIVGYTSELSIGAWAGNNDNSPMEKRVAGFIVAPMWHDFVSKALAFYPPQKFSKPKNYSLEKLPPVLRGKWQGGLSSFIDMRTGIIATEETPKEFIQERLSGGIHSILYWINKDNPREISLGEKNDPQFKFWEYSVLKWTADHNIIPVQNIIPTPETPTNPIITPTEISKPFVYFKEPKPNEVFNQNDTIDFSVGILHDKPISLVEYYINGKKVGESSSSPFNYNFTFNPNLNLKNLNAIRAVVTDIYGTKNDVNSSFRINI